MFRTLHNVQCNELYSTIHCKVLNASFGYCSEKQRNDEQLYARYAGGATKRESLRGGLWHETVYGTNCTIIFYF